MWLGWYRYKGWFILVALLLSTACSGDGTVSPDAGLDVVDSGIPDEGTDAGIDVPIVEDPGGGDTVDAASDIVLDEGKPIDEGSDPGSVDAGPEACNPALAMLPYEAHTNPYTLTNFSASGGTGAYRYEIVENASTSYIDPLTGSYLSGPTTGVEDLVRVVDLDCAGYAESRIHVHESMIVAPTNMEVGTSTSFTFSITSGSGVYDAEADSESGGYFTSGGGQFTYHSGAWAGTDFLEIRDIGTGETTTVVVHVVENPTFELDPAMVVLPVGQIFELGTRGGSGDFELYSPNENLVTMDGMIMALDAGTWQLTVVDTYLGHTEMMTIQAVLPNQFDAVRTGSTNEDSVALRTGDINGDGFIDAIFTRSIIHVTGLESGGLYIYGGTNEGLNPEPVRVIGGANRGDRFGSAAVVGDLDNDGLVDLVVGASHLDFGGGESVGSVYIYRGVAGAYFEDEPSSIYRGEFGGDQLGRSLSLCDFNGDGWLDIAMGGYQENRFAETVAWNQGAVSIFLGSDTGFDDEPSQMLYGPQPNGDLATSLYIGGSMVAGDLDGDELCDLAVSFPGRWDQTQASGVYHGGGVFVYRGVAAEGLSAGGLDSNPSVAVRGPIGPPKMSKLGHKMATGDVDGDGKDELLISEVGYAEWYEAGVDSQWRTPGRAYLLSDDNFSEEPVTDYMDPNELDWFVQHCNACWESVARAVDLTDVNNDGLADVLLTTHTSYSVYVYYGVEGGYPETTTSVVLSLAPEVTTWEEVFGSTVAAIGDVDNDGLEDILTFAARKSDLGPEVGRSYLVYGDPQRAVVPLGLPGEPSGHLFGRAVTVVSGGGSSHAVAVGAPLMSTEEEGIASGIAYSYAALDGVNFSSQPTQEYHGTRAGEQYGFAISDVGDFNNDGWNDLGIVGRLYHQPRFYDEASFSGETQSCYADQFTDIYDDWRHNVGAVYIYLGTGNGQFESEPAFLIPGAQDNRHITHLSLVGDINGDGYSDVVYGSTSWQTPASVVGGGFAVVLGRAVDPADNGKTRLICATDWLSVGTSAWDQVRTGAGIGDLNGDGCDDFLITEHLDDTLVSNAGRVFLIYGWSSTNGSCPSSPQSVALGPDEASAWAGYSVAGGGDLDGDGILDILVGAPEYRVDNLPMGAVWMVSGSYLLSLPTEDLQPALNTTENWPMIPFGTTAVKKLVGTTTDGRFGVSVGMIPGIEPDGRAAVMIGAFDDGISGTHRSGGAYIYRYDTETGFELHPWGLFGGESDRPGGRIGEYLHTAAHPSGVSIIVGGESGSGSGIDTGSAYSFVLPQIDE
ncbi:MAG: hypothetical protein CMH54_00100 [Myxococcales bacterium]|nr:hypothetical protein [Myxococcales bacterium]